MKGKKSMSSNLGNVDLSEVQQASTTGILRAFNLLEDEKILPKGEYNEQLHQTIFTSVCQGGDCGGTQGYTCCCGPCFKRFPSGESLKLDKGKTVKLTESLNRLTGKTRHKQRRKIHK